MDESRTVTDPGTIEPTTAAAKTVIAALHDLVHKSSTRTPPQCGAHRGGSAPLAGKDTTYASLLLSLRQDAYMTAGIQGALIGAIASLVGATLAYMATRMLARDQRRLERDRVMREERVAAYRAFLSEAMQVEGAMLRLLRWAGGHELDEIPDRATRVAELKQVDVRVHALAALASSVALVGPEPVWDATRVLYREFTYSAAALGMVCSTESDEGRKSCDSHFHDGWIVLERARHNFIEAARVVLGNSLEC